MHAYAEVSVIFIDLGIDCAHRDLLPKPRSKGDASMANTQGGQGGQGGGENPRRQGSGQQGGGQQGGNQDRGSGQGSSGENRKPSSGDSNRSDSGKTRDREEE